MRRALIALVMTVAAAAVLGAGLRAGPPAGLLAAARAGAAAALVLAGALGLGLRWGHGRAAALTLGLGALGALGVVALAIGAPPALAVGLGALAGALTGARALQAAAAAPRAGWAAAALLVVICAPTALAPPTDTDALYQHLGLAARMLQEGGLVGGPLSPDASRPLLLIGLWAGLLELGGPGAAALAHLGIAAALLIAVSARGERAAGLTGAALGPTLLAASWTFLHEGPLVGNNLPAALALLAAAGAAGAPRRAGLLLGLALSFKYTAALGLPLVVASSLSVRGAAVTLGVAALVVAPWPLRNLAEDLHPLFPYAGWQLEGQSLPFQHLEKYGAGRAPLDALLLPWRVIFDAERASFRFLGQLHPAMLPALGLALVGRGGRAGAARSAGLLLGLVGWAAGPQWLRHLLPLLPLLVINALEGLARILPADAARARAGWALALLAALGAPGNLWPALQEHAGRARAALSPAEAEALRAAEVPGAGATRWANANLPPDAVVGLLRSWDLLGIARRSRLGSVEDHTPMRIMMLHAPDAPLASLRAAGVTHLLVGPPAFLRAAYPFLSAAEYSALYDRPEAILEEALLREATLLYAEGGAAVYALDPPAREQ